MNVLMWIMIAAVVILFLIDWKNRRDRNYWRDDE